MTLPLGNLETEGVRMTCWHNRRLANVTRSTGATGTRERAIRRPGVRMRILATDLCGGQTDTNGLILRYSGSKQSAGQPPVSEPSTKNFLNFLTSFIPIFSLRISGD